jgi:hypothetical protein
VNHSGASNFDVPYNRDNIVEADDELNIGDNTVPSVIDGFPLLESFYPAGSSESEKARHISRLLQIALQPEEDF